LIHLDNDHKNYIDRSPKDKIVYSENEFNHQRNLFNQFFDAHQNLSTDKTWNDRFLRISTVENSIYECEEKINTKINQYIK
jgi:hypothetical protein